MFLRVFSPKLQTPVFNAVLFNTAARHHPACGFCLAEGSKRYFSAAKKKKKKGKRAANVAKNNPGGGIPGEFVMSVTGLSKQVGVRSIFEDVNLGFLQEAKIGILGLNGSGKSTFLKILCGVDDEFDGNLWIKDGLKVGYLPQEPELDPALSVRENVMSGLEKEVFLLKRFDEVSMEMGSDDADFDALLEEQAKLQTEIDNYDAWTLDKRVDMAMEALRVPEEGAEVATLSGGEVRRVALCRLLLERPDMLLLDEPTNHLDAESVEWLEIFLQRYKGTVVAITHDRYFLDNVAGWILELERGRALPFEGNYSSWLDAKQKRMNMENKKDAARSKAMAKELEWIRKGTRGQQKKGKARQKAYEENVAEAQKSGIAERLESGTIVIPEGPRLGNKVLSVKGLCHQFEDGRPLFNSLDFTVPKGALVGIVGGNGVGKSTLFRLLTGDIGPDRGTIDVGDSVHIGYVSQSRASLNANHTVYEEVAGDNEYIRVGDRDLPIRAYVSSFNLKGAAQEKRIGDLSGGERNRVHLAKTLSSGSNFILLDEPTNDLDVETLRSLEEALYDFSGSGMIISHDRYFLDRICSHVLAFEGNGDVVFFEGGWSEYLKASQSNLNIESDDQDGRKKRFRPMQYF
jgi:energy-dependent translational throttle protein EttA